MKAVNIGKACGVLALAFASFAGHAEGEAYSDQFISVDFGSVERHLTRDGIAYVFAATNESVVTAKRALTLKRALVVGGGGCGGYYYAGGGGGGGVILTDVFANPQIAAAGTIALHPGAGGCYVMDAIQNGSPSTLAVNGETFTAFGGGHGGANGKPVGEGRLGSGGGSGIYSAWGAFTNGIHYTASQGFPGGVAYNQYWGNAGGGGASEPGCVITSEGKGRGGEGLSCDITGKTEVYGSGGGASGLNLGLGTDYGKGGTNAGNGAGYGDKQAYGGHGRPGFGGGGGGGCGGNSDMYRYRGDGGCGTVVLLFGYPTETTGRLIIEAGAESGMPLSPAAGEYELQPGETRTLTASTGAASGGWRWSLQGCKISESADGGATWSAEEIVYARKIDFTQKGCVWTKVTWLSAKEQVRSSAGFVFGRDDGVEVIDTEKLRIVKFSAADNPSAFVLMHPMKLLRALVVGGGGAGGRGYYGSGGGGGGGVIALDDLATEFAAGTEILVKVGKGGAGMSSDAQGASGQCSSVFDGETLVEAYGGGGGASGAGGLPASGAKIASGGGFPSNGTTLGSRRYGYDRVHFTAGQGYPGGLRTSDYGSGSGGGGAGGWGTFVGSNDYPGNGGEGVTNDISGVAAVYGSGGGGSAQSDKPTGYDALEMALNGLGGTNAGMGGDKHEGGRSATSAVPGFGGGGGAACTGTSGSGGDGVVYLCFERPRGLLLLLR